jgi:hypothetical protein
MNDALRFTASASAPASGRRHTLTATAVSVDSTEPRLVARLVGWGDTGRPSDADGRLHEVTVHRGGLAPVAEVLAAYDDHRQPGAPRPHTVGAFRVRDEDDGLYADVELVDTPRARELHAIARKLPVRVSMEFDTDTTGDAFELTAEAPGRLTGLAVLEPPTLGAFPTAEVVLAAAMPDDPEPEPDDPEPEPDGTLEVVASLRAEVAETIRRELAAGQSGRGRAPHPLARFESFADLRNASADGSPELSAMFAAGYREHRDRMAALSMFGAFVDQTTGDNPGVVPPTWLTNVYGLIDQGRRVINALGGPMNAGNSGMDIHYPYIDPALDLASVVRQQAAEKADINSVEVHVFRGTGTLVTWAAGSDVSYQLLRRSSPPYLSIYERVLTTAYNLTTDTAMSAALVTANSSYVAWDPAANDASGDLITGAVIDAAVIVDLETGQTPTAILAGTNAFKSIAKTFGSKAPAYTTSNTGGVAQASNLHVEVSGLTVTHALGLDTDTAVVLNGLAAGWPEDGPFLISAEDVEKLGRDVAIWGMGCPIVPIPKGVVVLAAAAPAAESSRSKAK